MVGPYALVLADSRNILNSGDVWTLLLADGFTFVRKELLESAVKIWSPEVEGTVYEFLFEFDQGFPWARKGPVALRRCRSSPPAGSISTSVPLGGHQVLPLRSRG